MNVLNRDDTASVPAWNGQKRLDVGRVGTGGIVTGHVRIDELAVRCDSHRLGPAVERAREAYAFGGRCAAHLGHSVCGDPGTNILLDLFMAAAAGKRLSVTAACVGSRSAMATALRYLTLLQDAGMIERHHDGRDRRRFYVVLTASGWHKMLDLLDPAVGPARIGGLDESGARK